MCGISKQQQKKGTKFDQKRTRFTVYVMQVNGSDVVIIFFLRIFQYTGDSDINLIKSLSSDVLIAKTDL